MLKKMLSYVPGYRTGRTWKKIVATLFYIVFVLFLLMMFVSNEGTIDDRISKWQSLNFIVFFFVIPFLLVTNTGAIRSRLPLFRSKKLLVKGFAWLLSVLFLMIGFSTVDSKIDPLHTKEYLTAREIEREKQAKQEAIEKAKKQTIEPKKDSKQIAQVNSKQSVQPVETKPLDIQKKDSTAVSSSTTLPQKNSTNSEKSFVQSITSFFSGNEDFEKEKAEFTSDKIKKLTEREMKFLTTDKDYFGFGEEYFKLTLDMKDYVYFGELKDSLPHGLGIIYQVSFQDAGKTVFVPKYMGYFKDGRYHGFGIGFGKASRYYNDIFNLGGAFGFSSQDYSNLDALGIVYPIYEGYFADGNYEGKGKYMIISEDLRSEKPLNLQKYLNENDSLVQEHLKKLEKNEPQLLVSTLPPLTTYTKYAAEFEEGELSGEGKQFTKDGTLIYNGEFKNDMYNGNGKLYFESGKLKYEGEFQNGNYHGKGTLYKEDGSVHYTGQWEYGDIK